MTLTGITISPAELVHCTGTINFWDRKRQCGRLTGSLGFNISNCIGFEPRTNDEVTYCQIRTRKGHRAIHLEKLSGAAQGKKRPNVQRSGIDSDLRLYVLADPQSLPVGHEPKEVWRHFRVNVIERILFRLISFNVKL